MATERAAERRKAEEAAAKAERDELRALLAGKKVDEKVRFRLALAPLKKGESRSFCKVTEALISHGCSSTNLLLGTLRDDAAVCKFFKLKVAKTGLLEGVTEEEVGLLTLVPFACSGTISEHSARPTLHPSVGPCSRPGRR